MRLCCTESQNFLMTYTQQVWYSLYGWITSFAKAEQHLTGIHVELASLILPSDI